MTARPEAGEPEADKHHRARVLLAFGLDGLAVGAFVAAVLIIRSRGPQVGPDEGFFADPLPAGLMVLAFAATIAAGAVAAWALVREPLRTPAGRWAARLVIAFAVSFPVLGVITEVLGLEQGWAQPLVPPLMLAALSAMVLGAFAREPARRGLLLIPLVIGASAAIFALGEVLAPH